MLMQRRNILALVPQSRRRFFHNGTSAEKNHSKAKYTREFSTGMMTAAFAAGTAAALIFLSKDKLSKSLSEINNLYEELLKEPRKSGKNTSGCRAGIRA